jgi:hypothetical protein
MCRKRMNTLQEALHTFELRFIFVSKKLLPNCEARISPPFCNGSSAVR